MKRLIVLAAILMLTAGAVGCKSWRSCWRGTFLDSSEPCEEAICDPCAPMIAAPAVGCAPCAGAPAATTIQPGPGTYVPAN
jgi:hypothetical protein